MDRAAAERCRELLRTTELPGFDTPEAAALSGYSAAMKARVIRTEPPDHPDVCVVWVDTEPSHPLPETCVRGLDGAWYNVGTG